MAYGNLINRVMESGTIGQPEPFVGMPVTITHWSDRTVGYVNEIIRFKSGARAGQIKAVRLAPCHATRADNNGMSDAQHYTYSEFEAQPEGTGSEFAQDKRGRWVQRKGTSGLILGVHDYHYDFSF